MKVKDLLKAILVEEGIKDQDAYLVGRILDCVIEVSDECITVTHGSPVSSGMECLDNEIIYGACMAIEQEMTLKEMQEVVFPHPTVSEILKEVVFSFK